MCMANPNLSGKRIGEKDDRHHDDDEETDDDTDDDGDCRSSPIQAMRCRLVQITCCQPAKHIRTRSHTFDGNQGHIFPTNPRRSSIAYQTRIAEN